MSIFLNNATVLLFWQKIDKNWMKPSNNSDELKTQLEDANANIIKTQEAFKNEIES